MEKQIISCMGGWCSARDRCAHYWSESNRISERLCAAVEQPVPVTEKVIAVDFHV